MNGKIKLSLGLGLVSILVAGFAFFYHPVHTVSYDQLLDAAKPNYQNTIITTTSFCGSKNGYDYFVIIPPFSREKHYRVSIVGSPITKRFPLSSDRKQWQVFDPLSPIGEIIFTNRMSKKLNECFSNH